MTPSDRRFFDRPADIVAAALIGWTFLVEGAGGVVVETEAYDRTDPASHSVRGPTPRNASMFGPPAYAYVYRSYGLHWCLNLVCEPGSAVLLRALAPTAGLDAMRARRGLDADRLLCAGPGRLAQALGIDRTHDGRALDAPPFAWGDRIAAALAVGPRIGLTRGIETPWRFGAAGSRYLSRPFPRAGRMPPRDA